MTRLHILVADDDVQNQRMLSLILKRMGHSLVFASNGREVVNAVVREPFDLVLMDVLMPQMDGIEATRQIRALENGKGRIPIIGLTAVIEVEYARCLEAGMDRVLSKPLDVDELDEVIASRSKGIHTFKYGVASSNKHPRPVVLDIESAIHRIGGDEEDYKKLLDEFIHSLPARYDELMAVFASGNLARLSERAHNLKGLAASLGCLEFSRIAMELDELANQAKPDSAGQKIDEIRAGMNNLHNAASAYLNISRGETGNSAL